MTEPQSPAAPAYGVPRQVTEFATVLLARNPSPMTLEGTNTWVLRAAGTEEGVVIDPGPDDSEHLDRLAALGPVGAIVLTHHHSDHSGGARRFAERVRAPLHAADPALRWGPAGSERLDLDEGRLLSVGGLRLRVLATPGHTADSRCLSIEDAAAVLTGDTILGRGPTVVAHPDGRLVDYLATLRRLIELPAGLRVLPGHGPDLPDLRAVATAYLEHRSSRLDQVRSALAELGPDATAGRIVESVYAAVDRSLWPAAEWSVAAQLEYLREHG
ncbi:MBL fold metallo-hydrolase [Actinoalloteichus hymeniacidonis]|uniref:Zn-dependent hydrolase, glyoxylase n=1 Tax=Actinoalloteichus hymeniacidonis TaxID=340345 RepID=A0AAC9MWA5_9PSEU|nr:MBL fold metallo-hydrolase [Actinoalloteichus hymeniacidonis]AOS61095.1 Zn-dependent hydrolase, glyoxylase [Actinoalloteichus hymeniacidonis]MBB5910904.1 glyoxylase-like metal-dependent hydrolase (beta-lactamase superfamily II) [Actinoalloteichus hymeniacidonis]